MLAQLLADLVDARDRLLHAARDVDRPRAVAEMALELAEDGGDGEGGEGDAALGVVTVDSLDQAEIGDLTEVVKGFAGVAVLDGQRARERHVQLDEALPRQPVSSAGPLPQISGVTHGSADPTLATCRLG